MIKYTIKYNICDKEAEEVQEFEAHITGYNLLDAQVRLIRKLQSLGMPLFVLKIGNKYSIEYLTKYKNIIKLMNKSEEVA